MPFPRLSKRSLSAVAGVAAAASALVGLLMYLSLELPAPTGIHAVGREEFLWASEESAESNEGPREVGVVLWYPAVPSSGTRAPYIKNLSELAPAFVASGELSRLQASGLRFVRGHARQGASLAESSDSYPVIVFSPGNATNVQFYAGFAEELASNGYVVVGMNHPGQATAMFLGGGETSVYADDPLPGEGQTRLDVSAPKVRERVLDMEFVLERLASAPEPRLAGRLDLTRIGVMGHSLGGVAAAEFCSRPGSVRACLNLDGSQAGGPFTAQADPQPPVKPFMFLTKEPSLHPALEELFERATGSAYRVVVPGATHEQFADGPMFSPDLWPFGTSARDVVTVSRGFARAFFDVQLRDDSTATFGKVEAPTDVYVYGYPLRPR